MGSHAGPNVARDSLYNYHVCTTSGTFTPNFSGNVEVLVVAGGGGGGMDMGGGGGGGGVLSSTSYAVTAGTPITVTVGAGGVGAPAGAHVGQSRYHQFTIGATQGGNSVFGSLTAVGGGYGGSSYYGYLPNYGLGGAGGSGGGASGYTAGATVSGGSGTSGQGNRGGNSGGGSYYSGGGGGAGGAGADGPNTPHGGAGVLNTILGRNLYWGGGGGGSSYSSSVSGNGGIGGGGGAGCGITTGGEGYNNGLPGATGINGDHTNAHGGHGGQNTGGGGGGGSHYNRSNYGGNGGSGIVIIRYLKTLGTSTFNTSGVSGVSSLILSLDAANTNKSSAVELLIVAGGGGGGMDMGGGGGGGGVIYRSSYPVSLNVGYSVVVGAGGTGSPGPYGVAPPGSNGGNSSFNGLTALGGGGGGSGHYRSVTTSPAGLTGGCGGGNSAFWGEGPSLGGSGTPGQGYHGGTDCGYDGRYSAGGGGGAGQSGSGGPYYNRGGCGGNGFLSSINGSSLYWGGGGGGAVHTSPSIGGPGGLGGGGGGAAYAGYTGGTGGGSALNSGGNGAAAVHGVGGNGGANTGGGGGGGSHWDSDGGNGGSGIVIVRYYGSQKATGGTITSANGYTVHTFTSSGTFTPTGFLNWRDSSERNYNCILYGEPTFNASNGGSIVFDGVNDYAEIDSTDIISGTNPFTFECFYYTNGSYNAELFGNYGSGYTSNTIWISGRYGVWINGSSPYFPGAPLGAGTYYMTFTRDSAGNCVLYLNGNQVATATNTASISSSQKFRIGSDVAAFAEQLAGNIYSLKVYNRVLSAAEVKQNFQALRGRFGI